MIRASCFALLSGRRAAERAVEEIARRSGHPGKGLLLTEDQLRPVTLLPDRGRVVLVCAPEGGGYPVLHGFADGPPNPESPELPEGEYACIGRDEAGSYAARDVLGTRALYLDGTGSVASDSRLLAPDARLLPAGTALRLPSREAHRFHLGRAASCGSLEEAVEELVRLLKRSVRSRTKGLRKVAVSFSGGLDSSLVALLASRERETVLCSAFVRGSRDERQTRKGADLLGLEYASVSLDGDATRAALREMYLPSEPTSMDRALWCLYSSTSRLAYEAGAGAIMLGQLADELFGGYAKYARGDDGDSEAEETMRRDVLSSSERGFPRDEAACTPWVEPRFPFADRSVVELALSLPLSYKIEGQERKVVLREAARALGLPEELAGEPKKAAQYSSGLLKLLS